MTTKLTPRTALERHVARWINNRASEYDNGIEGVMNDLSNGCSSGIVGHLIYYKDTLAFYRKHRAEINALLAHMIDNGVLESPSDMSDWDASDPLAQDTHNQNLLAWFGFEETAHNLVNTADILAVIARQ